MMSETADLKKLGEMLRGIRIAMLTTADAMGTLRSRPMATQKLEFDGDLWFFTRGQGGKVEEIDHNAHVNVAYAMPNDNRYVSVSGTAKVVHDDMKMHELWDPSYSEYFPGGLSDPDLALLKVEVQKAEYWTAPGSAIQQTKQAKTVGFNRGVMTSRAGTGEDPVRPVTGLKGEASRGDHGAIEVPETHH